MRDDRIKILTSPKPAGQIAKVRQSGYETLDAGPLVFCLHLNQNPCILALTGIHPIGRMFGVRVAMAFWGCAVHRLM